MKKKDESKRKNPLLSWNPSRTISDIRAGLDEDSEDYNKKNLAMLARVIGFAMLISAILYFINALQRFGVLH